MRALMLAALVTSAAASAADAPKNADLERAQKALAAKKYPEALKAIEAAEKKGGLDLDAHSTLLESKALALASTRKLDKAEEEFKKLLVIDPRRDLSGKYKGDVVKALEAALAWVSKNGGLQVIGLEPTAANGKVSKVGVQVKNDPLGWAKTARIWVRDAGGQWKSTDAALTNGAASADADGADVEYWVELHDASRNQVKLLGSPVRPQHAVAPAVVAEAPKPSPKAEAAPVAAAPVRDAEPVLTPREDGEKTDAAVTDESPKSGSMLRPVSYVLLGAGVISAGIGVYFGATSMGARSQILMDSMAMTFTQQQLYDRDQARIGQAQIANALFITAAALAVVGVVLFVLGG